MDVVIAKHFDFEASHQLPNEDCYGKCRDLHGHRYELVVSVSGKVNKKGWIVNFSSISKIIKDNVVETLDHTHLNDRIELPTAENILFWIKHQIELGIIGLAKEENPTMKLHSIKLYETARSYAELMF